MTLAVPAATASSRQAELFEPGSNADALGDTFCIDNDAQSRRAHGITLTPPWLVGRMLDEVQGRAFQTIVDCGAGTGRFAIAAALRFPRARVVAVEQHPELVALLRQRVRESGLAQRVSVIEGDFREVHLPLQGRSLFIGNPPYVRHHDIAPDWKAWYARCMAALGLGASQLAGLHAHFMVRAGELMRPGDAMCFVTSAEWLDNGYGQALRGLFSATPRLALRGLWLADAAQPVFADALVSSVVVHAECGEPATPVRTGMLSEQKLQTLRQLDPVQLRDAGRWSPWCRPTLAAVATGIELGELFRVTRGQVTGLNAAWVLKGEHFGLPLSLSVAAVTRAKEIIDGVVLTQTGAAQLKRVVSLPADLDTLPADQRDAALRFLAHARNLGADQSYIARHRKPWYAVGMRAPPAAFVSYMGRRPPVFCANPWRASFINIAHGLYPRQAMDGGTLQRVLQHLNTTTDLHAGRMYGGGMAKFEPSDVARLRVPAEVLEAAT